jgi:allantoinase
MEDAPPFAVVSDRIATPEGIRPGAVLIDAGRIKAVVAPENVPDGYSVDDVSGSVILPGLVSHIGAESGDGERFERISREACSEGITTLLEVSAAGGALPTSVAALEKQRAAADGRLLVDCGFIAGVTPDNEEELDDLAAAGVYGFKARLAGGEEGALPLIDETAFRRTAANLSNWGVPLLVPAGAEDRSDDAADTALRVAERTRCRVHLLRLSSARRLDAIKRARSIRVPVSAETTLEFLDPASRPEDADGLWSALERGTVDMIARGAGPKLLSAVWGAIESRKMPLGLVRIAEWLSAAPARVMGLSTKGAVAGGFDADLAVFDPEAETPGESSATPRGRVVKTYLRGRLIYEDGTFPAAASGRLLSRPRPRGSA